MSKYIDAKGKHREIEIISLTEFRRQEYPEIEPPPLRNCNPTPEERLQQFGGATGMKFDPDKLNLNAEEWAPDYELAKRIAKI